MVRATLDGDAYVVEGQRYPRLSTILEATGQVQYDGIPGYVLQLAAHRGTAVHRCAELEDAGLLDVGSVRVNWWPYVEAYRRFVAHHGPVWEHIESALVHPGLGYGCTIDRAGTVLVRTDEWRGERMRAVVELKTTKTLQDAVRLQTAAQALCLDEPHARFVCWLKGDGSYVLCPYTDDAGDRRAFLACLAAYHGR